MAPTRIQIERILCPTDYSPFSTRALERAVRLADWFDARVTALHVIPYLVPAGPGLPYFPLPLEATPQSGEAARALDRFVEPFRGERVAIETTVRQGDPAQETLAAGEALGADLVVMGTHGRSGFAHLLLGSVTEKVLRHVRCPLLTVRSTPTPPAAGPLFRRILCAADLKDGSGTTIDFALSLAEESEAELTLLHVLESGSDPASYAKERLRRAVPPATRDFCQVKARVMSGTPWRGILLTAEETRAELIVVGAHGRPIERMLFGSTASHVVRHAACPVLVVRETEARRTARTGREAESSAVMPAK
jgi:nucleotide-binding universal stress UspA family protein